MEEMTYSGIGEEEIGQLRRVKMDLDRRVKEQEEELDEMAGQVQVCYSLIQRKKQLHFRFYIVNNNVYKLISVFYFYRCWNKLNYV